MLAIAAWFSFKQRGDKRNPSICQLEGKAFSDTGVKESAHFNARILKREFFSWPEGAEKGVGVIDSECNCFSSIQIVVPL